MRSTVTLLFFISFRMLAYTPGDLDTTFNPTEGIATTPISSSAIGTSLIVQPDSKIVLGGYAVEGINVFAVVRYTTEGALDPSFNGGGIIVQNFSDWPTLFPPGPAATTCQINSVGMQADGTILCAGSTGNSGPWSEQGWAFASYLTPNGAPNPSFGPHGGANTGLQITEVAPVGPEFCNAILPLANGQFMGGGNGGDLVGVEQAQFVLYNANGSVDNNFNSASFPIGPPFQPLMFTSGNATSLALRSINGQVYAGGVNYNYNDTGRDVWAVMRFFVSASPEDHSWIFASSGTPSVAVYSQFEGAVTSVAYYEPTDQLYVAGQATVGTIIRLNNDTTIDTSFGNSGVVTWAIGSSNSINALAIQPDTNKLLAGGWATVDGMNCFVLARYNFDGSLDASFGTDGIAITPVPGASNAQIASIAFDSTVPNETKLVAGGVATIGGVNQFAAARYLIADVPTADNGSVTVDASVTTIITLTGNEPFSQLLTFSITQNPFHGLLGAVMQPSVGAPVQTATVPYTPTLTYTGSDSFSFLINNGLTLSTSATINLSVIDTVSASSQLGLIFEVNSPTTILLGGYDAAAVPLTFTITSNPSHGTLGPITQPHGGTLVQTATIIYTPIFDFLGPDSFTFDVTNGYLISSTALISFTVEDVPIASKNSFGVIDHIPNCIFLTAADPLSALLTFSIITPPSHGSLSPLMQPLQGAPIQYAHLTYTPTDTFTGLDSFTFQAHNGLFYSQPSNIAPINLRVVNAGTDPFTIRLIQKYGNSGNNCRDH